jgi:hypothetical protein
VSRHFYEFSPTKSRHFVTYIQINTNAKRKLLINDKDDVWVNKNIKTSVVESGCDILMSHIIRETTVTSYTRNDT